MAAANTDLFMKVGNPGTATTLSSPGYTIGNTSITVGSTANFPTDTGVVFSIDTYEVVNNEEVRVDGSYCVFAGTVASGTSITNLDLLYGTPQDYASGAATRVYITVSSEHTNRLIQGILEEHNQDGSHGAVTADSVSTDTVSESTTDAGVTIDGLLVKDSKLATNNSIVTANITDAAITNAKLGTAAGELAGAWETWTPTITGVTIGNGKIVGRKRRIGKTCELMLAVEYGSTSTTTGSTGWAVPTPTGMDPATDVEHFIGSGWSLASSIYYAGASKLVTSTKIINLNGYNNNAAYSNSNPNTATTATRWGFHIVYEAA